MSDSYHLERFLEAQSGIYDRVINELSAGQKDSHWIWFIFPQIRGLGHTETSIFFAISSLPETRAYLEHPVLGPRLRECCDLLLWATGQYDRLLHGHLQTLDTTAQGACS